MEDQPANSDLSNPRDEENEESDDNIICINIDGLDLTDNENQDDNPCQPKEEIKDPSYSNVSNNQDLNMEAEDNSLNDHLKPTFNTTYQNESGLNPIEEDHSEALNKSPEEPNRNQLGKSSCHEESSSNDMIVNIDLNNLNLEEKDEETVPNIKQDEEESKKKEKIKMNGNMSQQPLVSTNNSVMHMFASPNTPNMETTPDLELLNIVQNPKTGVQKLLEAEAPFQIEEDNMNDSDNSDAEMKITVQYDKENGQFFIQDDYLSSDKSESAISLNIKRSKERLVPVDDPRPLEARAAYNNPHPDNDKEELMKIVIPSQDPESQKAEAITKFSVPISPEETSKDVEMEEEKQDPPEDTKISINLGEDTIQEQNLEDQIQIHETNDPFKIKLTGKFPEMSFDDVDVSKYYSQIIDSEEPQRAYSSQPTNSNLVKITLQSQNEDDYTIRVPNIEATPEKEENKIQISMTDIDQSPDDGKISIPLLDPNAEEEKQESSVFRIPTDLSEKSKEPWNERKRDEKFRSKNEGLSQFARERSETFGEESKIEQVVIEDSIRKYYKLELQKVNLHVSLPKCENSQEGQQIIKGQTIFMFNRLVDEDANKDSIRKLGLNFHSKYLKITKISTAKRFRKRDNNQKVIDTYHQRKDDLEYDFDEEEFKQFYENYSHNKNQIIYENNQPNTTAFERRPCIQEFEYELSGRFHHERGKGLVNIQNVLNLEAGDLFPQNLDLIVDFEITEIPDSGLIYRETLDPSNQGGYIASAHRYFETHHWLPCIDTLRQKNKWRITIITDKDYEVACSGYLEKIIEIEDSDQRGYLYRVDNYTAALKIGFFVGSHFTEHNNKYFSTKRKLDESISLMGHDGKFEEDIVEIFENYLNKDIPYEQIDLVFVPNLFFDSNNKRRVICYAGMCLLDERLICTNTTIDRREEVHFHISYAIASNYFGCYMQEESYLDFWVIEGIAQALASIHTRVKCGKLLHKFNILKKIEYLTERVRRGLEIYPLCTENTPHPSYIQYEDHYFVKSEIIMHILENRIQEHFSKLLRILIRDCAKSNFTLNTKTFMRRFKKVCGFTPKFLYNWLYKTGAAEITVSQNWNKKNNTIELEIEQQNLLVHYLEKSNVINRKKEEGNLTRNNINNESYEYLQAPTEKKSKSEKRSYNLEAIREGARLFRDNISLFLYETDGTFIKPEQHKLELSDGKVKINLTFPLKSKVKRNNTAKKKDNIYGPALAQENWLFQPSDSVCSADGEFYKSDIFKTKNIECSLLWLRVDPDLSSIRTVYIKQDENSWHYQLLREKDIVGQYEAIHHLKKIDTETAYEALKYVIVTDEFFYKIREEALQAISQMNTRVFNIYLSTERFLMKVYNEYEENFANTLYQNDIGKEDLKYRKSAIRYFFDQTLIRVISEQKSFSSRMLASDPSEYNLKVIQGYTNKELNKWLLDLLKKNYSDKLVFEDTYFVANLIKACGNMLSMKLLPDTVLEIIRQGKVDLSRSNNIIEYECGSYNNLLLISSIQALTTIFDNLQTLKHQLVKNVEQRMKKRHQNQEANANNKDRKQLNKKIQREKENIHKIHKEVPLIKEFFRLLQENAIYHKNLEIQLEVFKFKIVEIFSENDFMKSMYKALVLVNEEIEYERITKATGCLKTFTDYLQKRIFVTRDLDYLELFDYASPKNNAIYEILWQMATLEFAFQNEEFRQVISSLIWMLYREVKLQHIPLASEWLDFDKIQPSIIDEKSYYDNL